MAAASLQANETLLEHAREVFRKYAPDNWVELESPEIDLIDMQRFVA